jgi:lipopolysaccharide transport system ATP-binding protein
MSEIAIRVEGISKQYRIGARRERYKSLRDTIADAARWPMGAVRSLFSRNGPGAATEDTFWALQDVSFEIKRGDVVGVIGRNGAGKSTLLKILSRITDPTAGRAEIHGRVGSLLEVGTGFHPELTGRENIYLNGAILGMKKTEIDRKFDEMVAFAEVEKFIDTMVKHYSSGMYLRLAFAVAAHLEPEILLVDEVLAVGDAQFQRKCFSKMSEVAGQGRTILFVSHNLSAVRLICGQGLILDRGQLAAQGTADEVSDLYLTMMRVNNGPEPIIETDTFTVHGVKVTPLGGTVIKTFDPVRVTVLVTPKQQVEDVGLYVGIQTVDGQLLAGLDLKDFQTVGVVSSGATIELGFHINSLPLLPGSYQLELHLKDMATGRIERIPSAFAFDVAESPVYGGRKLDHWFGRVGLKATPLFVRH